VDPVRINTNELYDILRTRLFQSLPSEEAIDAVAEAYRQAVDKAKLMDITAASPEQIKTEVRNAYPFHPAIRDLYARFKENPGFQQTRALIRIMRLIVAGLWSSGEARRQYLVGAEDLDLHRQEILSEVRQINSTLDTAVAHDIAATGGGSVAEQIDRGESSDAQDVCRLVFLSSLSQAMNPTLGLDRSDIVRSLATPGRDPTNLRAAIDRLQSEAWYLHATRDGKLLFRNTENLIAKLDSYTKNKLKEQKEGELRERLQEMFAPKLKSCYQELLCLPALDQVQLSQDSVTLIIFRPVPGAVDDIRQFYEHQQYKNRVMFLTGSAPAYETVLQRAASLSAIRAIIGEMKTEGRQESDPQFIDAETIKTKQESLFYQACRETFQTLHYPSKNELTPLELDPKYVANEYKGEDQVRDALKEAYKYREDTSAESSSFRTSLENKLWPATQKEVPWSSIKQRAATDPSWVWQHPRALDDLKTELIKRDIWREHGTFVERGPFPQPQASLTVQVVSRNEKTGETTLRLRPLHGDIVYKTESGLANTNSERLENFEITTKALRLSFLAADSSGEHETGEPQDWKATISLKHRFYQDADNRRCELQALPGGTIRYSIDGSGPESYGHVYSEPFTVPADCRVVLAIAGDDGVSSPVARFDVPRVVGEGSAAVVASVDPGKPVTWRRVQRRDDTNATYIWLELAQKYRARLGGVRLQAAFGTRWFELRTAEDVSQPANQVLEQASLLKTIVPEGNVDLDVESLHFESGRDLQDMVADMKETLLSSEVEQ
ncbi:MAG: DUF499 domain-containing protein, partial [Dehalococcoidia bacterium]